METERSDTQVNRSTSLRKGKVTKLEGHSVSESTSLGEAEMLSEFSLGSNFLHVCFGIKISCSQAQALPRSKDVSERDCEGRSLSLERQDLVNQ